VIRHIICGPARPSPELAAHLADVATWPDPYESGPILKPFARAVVGGVVVEAGQSERPARMPSERHVTIEQERDAECDAMLRATAQRIVGRMNAELVNS
jgi:hypothetical protein